MADTFTPYGKIRLPQTGAYEDQWGAVLNSDAFTLFDDMISGQSAISLTGAAYSLPAMANGSDSDTRSFCLRFDGTPPAAVTVTVPASVSKKFYLVDNRCGQDITFTYGSGNTALIANGDKRIIWCDGTGCYRVSANAENASSIDGISLQYLARTGRTADEISGSTLLTNTFVEGVRNVHPWVTVTEGPTTTINAASGNHHRLTLTGNRAMAAPANAVDGQRLVLQVRQDASGGRTLTWHSSFVFESGLPPTLAAGANGMDLFLMYYDAANGQWIVGHFASIGSTATASLNLTIEGNQQDVNLAALLGTVSTPVVLTVTIAQGTVLSAGSVGSYALDLANALPSGSTLNLVNLGYILGRGGNGGGGNGGHVTGSGNFGWNFGNQNGGAGGAALRGPGSGVTWNITNGAGFIWGGGGGGGGGAASITGNGGAGCGGGGGGGAGGGMGAPGGSVNNATRGGNGGNGSTGVNGTFGAGGSSATSGSATAAAGGNGGDWGAAGSAGSNDGAGGTGGSAGAAGKAIELNSGAATFISGNGSPNIEGAVS